MKRNRIAVYIIIVVIVLSLFSSWIAIARWGNSDSFSDKFGILLSVVSMVISVVALVYSMITYYSIDRVQAINSMEGNVLCNSKYSVAYPESISYFEQCRDNAQFNERLFDLLIYKRVHNCRDYAVRIQIVIDNLLWIAYAEHDSEFYEKCDVLLSRLETDRARFSNVNSGLSDVIDENLKLIKHVIDYQNHKIRNTFTMSRLENIRGRLLENPIAAITYYDYLGLEYMRRARGLLGDNDIFTAEKMNRIEVLFKEKENEELREKYLYMLEISESAFYKASIPAENDTIWNGYISYNIARVMIMKYLLDPAPEEKERICEYLKTVVDNRKKVLYTVWGDRSFDEQGSYLNKRFQREVSSAIRLSAEFGETK